MTDFTAGNPADLLSGTTALRRTVRSAQRATWFPLAVFAALSFGAVPAMHIGHRSLTCQSVSGPPLGARVCSVYTNSSFVYWSIALVVGYAATVAFYRWRAGRLGVGSRVLPYVVIGLALAAAVTVLAIWDAHHPLDHLNFFGTRFNATTAVGRALERLTTPEGAIGLGLLILARVERSLALLAFTIGYLVIVANGTTFGWTVTPHSWLFTGPRAIVAGIVLAVGAVAFAIIERPTRPA